jgi:hypothetical protein
VPAVIHARRVLLLDAAGEINPDLGQLQARRPSKFAGMTTDEIREYRRLQYQARKNGTRYLMPAPVRVTAKRVAEPKPKRKKQTPEERRARRRALYQEQKAKGILHAQGKKTPYALLSEEEKQRRRDYQLARYHANREKELARAKARYAAMTPEQKAIHSAKGRAWVKANRERVNRQDRERRAARKAQAQE